MTPRERQAREAWNRFKRLEDDWQRRSDRAWAGGPTAVEPAARVATRLRLIDPADGLGRERVFGRSDLLPVNYLLLGRRATRAVCRLQVRNLSGRHEGFGTGFLVSPDLLLTNHHVLEAADKAVRSLAEFDAEEDEDFRPRPRKTFRLDPQRLFFADADLDFALVAVAPRAQDDTALSEFGFLPLIEDSGKALVNEPVTIIQHPDGADKQIALRNNHVLGLADDFIHYATDTLTGSSGSPVLNDQWQVVALHHAAVARRDERGRVLARDGTPWKEAMGESEIDWVANEGLRISSLFARLRAKADWQPGEIKLLAGMGLTGLGPAPGAGGLEAAGPEREALPVFPVGRPITLDEFHALADHPATTEADLAPYVRPAPEMSGPFDPAFRIDRTRVIDVSGLESDRALTWANGWCRSRRQRAYRRKIGAGGDLIKIVSEGDSWFQYPFLLDDVIDHLMAEPDFAVLSLDAAGDLLGDMIASGEYLNALAEEDPSVFLISGGGNDLVVDGRLSERLRRFDPALAPEQYPNSLFEAFLHDLRINYRRLFSSVREFSPDVRVFCHGYDYAVPNRGDWLGRPMERNGITDRTLQKEIIRVVMDRVNDMLRDLAGTFDGVTFLDLRGRVPANEWYDELHPVSRGYKRVADVFIEAIRGG